MSQNPSRRAVSPHLVETVRNRLRLAFAVLPEWSRPDYTERYVDLQKHGLVDVERGSTSLTPGLKNFINEAMAEIRRVDLDSPAPAGDSFGARLELRPIYPNGGFDPERFILASVGQDEFPRSFPVDFPIDVVAFGLYRFGSLENQLRLFGYLVRTYSDAVRLAGDPVGLGRELVRSLGVLTCALSDLVAIEARNRADDAGDSASDSDDSTDQSDPIDNVERAEKRQQTSPSVGGSPSGCSECGCSGSNPAEGEVTNKQDIYQVAVADPDKFVRAVDERLGRTERMRDL